MVVCQHFFILKVDKDILPNYTAPVVADTHTEWDTI